MGDERITLHMTTFEVLYAMSEGNPGALTVCMEILKQGEAIDPDGFAGGLGAILGMDTHRIYGSDIWLLYKDVCGEDLTKMLGVLRAVQLGIISEGDMKGAIRDRNHALDPTELLVAVQERLPLFGLATTDVPANAGEGT